MSSEQTEFLSPEERAEGLLNYQRHSFWNGLGIHFLNTPIISLLAISFGASNLQLGYISSVFHFAGIVLIFVARLLNGRKIKSIFFWAWFLRGLICFLYVVLFFLDGQAAVAWILALYTLFAVSRVIGVPMAQPIQKKLVKPAEEGGFLIKLHLRLTFSQLISQVISFLLMSLQYFSGLTGLVLLTLFGATNNTVSSMYLRKIPSRERVEYRKGKNTFVLLAETLRHAVRGRILVVRVINLAGGILLTFGIAFLRRSVGMPSNMVFLYTLIGAVAALASTRALQPFIDTVGSRSLLVFSSIFLMITSLAWAAIPTDLPWVVYFLLGFLAAFFLRLRLLMMSRLLIRTLPTRDRISYTTMLNFVSAIIGLGVGLAGGGLADFTEARQLAVPHIYTFTYIFAAVTCLVSAVLSIKIHDPGSLSIRETAAVFLSVKNIRAYIDIYQLDITEDQKKRESTMLSLEQNDTQIATEQLQALLKSPLPWEKERILRSLASYPRQELIDDIIREAQDPFSYNRRDAIHTLGSYSSRKSANALLSFIDDENPEVAAASLRSLGRIGVKTDLWHIYKILDDPALLGRAEIDALRALSLMDEEGEYISRIFSLVPKERGRRFQQLAFILCARSLQFSPPLSDYFKKENQKTNSGFLDLANDSQELGPFHDDGKRLKKYYRESRFDEIWTWCADKLREIQANARLENLRAAIVGSRPSEYSRTNTIAAAYFTYQLLKNGGPG
jgi:hypothetical protein